VCTLSEVLCSIFYGHYTESDKCSISDEEKGRRALGTCVSHLSKGRRANEMRVSHLIKRRLTSYCRCLLLNTHINILLIHTSHFIVW
jgi:hypothetical protein